MVKRKCFKRGPSGKSGCSRREGRAAAPSAHRRKLDGGVRPEAARPRGGPEAAPKAAPRDPVAGAESHCHAGVASLFSGGKGSGTLSRRQGPPGRGEEARGKAGGVTHPVRDVPVEHHLGLLLSLLGPVQHEAKSPIDHLTPAGGKGVSRPDPAWSRQKCTHVLGTFRSIGSWR